MKTPNLLFSALVLFSVNLIAHGENKPGPHGGFIRMPGPFHTEVVPQPRNQIQVYLLDMKWENPSVKASSVKATLKNKKSLEGRCEPKADHFLCTFDKPANFKKGELIVEATREEQKGNAATYPLPLKLDSAPSMHH